MSRASRALDAVGAKITAAVGTMYCALLFAGIAIVGTPGLFPPTVSSVAQWLAQSFLSLVLLSVIMVGQRIDGSRAEVLIQETHDAVIEELAAIKALVPK